MNSSENNNRNPEIYFVIFLLGLVLLNWPFLNIANLLGPQSMFIYFFLIWGILILFSYKISAKDNHHSQYKEEATDVIYGKVK